MKTDLRTCTVFVVVFILLAISVLSGCSGFFPVSTTATGTTHTTKPTTSLSTKPPVTTNLLSLPPIQIGTNVLYKDDFSNSGSGWLTGDKYGGDFYYESGEYSLLEINTQYFIYASMNKNIGGDYSIQIDARFLDLGKNGSCGIVFRQQGDSENANFYIFSINNDSFRLVARVNGQWHNIQDWKKSEFVRPLPNTNRIAAACLGSRIDLYANGQLLGTYTDNLVNGAIFGVTASEANTHVHFDNMVIYNVTAPTVNPNPGPPDSAKQYYNQAVQYRKSGDYTQAVTYYKKAITEYYQYYEAWHEEAQVYYQTGEYDKALNCYYTATQINPQDGNAWVDEGRCLEKLGRNDEAMSCYNKALQLDPNNADAKTAKDALLARGVPDNNNDPPVKQYDNTRPLKLTGPVMVIHLKEGEPFSTSFSVEGGTPPYYWRLITTNGVANNVLVAGNGPDGSTADVTGLAAMIESPSSTAREARVEIAVEDSSDLTRQGPGSFWLHVDNTDTDESEIAAQVARDWYSANYGDVNNMMRNALAGVGFGGMSETYSRPVQNRDGSYQVTVSMKAFAATQGAKVTAIMDVILTINTKTKQVTNAQWGNVRVSY